MYRSEWRKNELTIGLLKATKCARTSATHQDAILPTWFNFNPSMDK